MVRDLQRLGWQSSLVAQRDHRLNFGRHGTGHIKGCEDHPARASCLRAGFRAGMVKVKPETQPFGGQAHNLK
jgi:hypothetical protein